MNSKCFYVTTPIYYASSNVQLGNTYTTIACDVWNRFKKLQGYDVRYLTGMDEHGKKVEDSALANGVDPQTYVNKIAQDTKNLWKTLHVDYDDFVQTSEPRHTTTVQKIFEQLLSQDDIYLGSYEGDYCVSCESFFTKTQVAEGNTCPDCGKQLKKISEPAYFLRLGKYQERLLDYIKTHPDFIQPKSRENEIVSFVEAGLDDLCVSRTTVNWGIPVLSNPQHTVYVWIDALSNYISTLGYLSDDDTNFKKYWVNSTEVYHVLGKDIVRFHAVYWTIMLMALNIPINCKMLVHGWILNKDGKMSKSKGNAVYPLPLVDRYGVDALRYYLAKELPLGNDGLFSYERFVERYNNDLANSLGNLLSRTVAMVNKYFGGVIPKNPGIVTEFDQEIETMCQTTLDNYQKEFSEFHLQNGMNIVWDLLSRANKYIDETAPWALAKDPLKIKELESVLYHLMEILRFTTSMVAPFLVESSVIMSKAIGLEGVIIPFKDLHFGFTFQNNVISEPVRLFERLNLAVELAFFNEIK